MRYSIEHGYLVCDAFRPAHSQHILPLATDDFPGHKQICRLTASQWTTVLRPRCGPDAAMKGLGLSEVAAAERDTLQPDRKRPLNPSSGKSRSTGHTYWWGSSARPSRQDPNQWERLGLNPPMEP